MSNNGLFMMHPSVENINNKKENYDKVMSSSID